MCILQNDMSLSLLTQQQQNKKMKHKNPCRSRELIPGPLAPTADALRLHLRDN